MIAAVEYTIRNNARNRIRHVDVKQAKNETPLQAELLSNTFIFVGFGLRRTS
jgi:hypothetical protein